MLHTLYTPNISILQNFDLGHFHSKPPISPYCSRMFLLHLILGAVVEIQATVTQAATPHDAEYICPQDCLCTTLDLNPTSLMQLVCPVEAISNTTDFEAIPPLRTSWLTIKCVTPVKSKLYAHAFTHLIELEELKLLNCSLSELPLGLLSQQRLLRRFVVQTQDELHVPHGVFQGAALLEELTINAEGGLTNFSTEELCPLKHLNYLDLSGSLLAGVVGTAKHHAPCHRGLTIYDISENSVVDLNIVFAEHCCPQLHTLNISYNSLSHIKTTVFQGLFQLQVLELSNNLLSNLCLENMNVVHLYLSHNNLIDLSLNLSTSSLQTLDIAYNNLTTDIVDKLHLPNIKVLKMCYNRIVYIPKGLLSHASLLTELDLSGNHVSALPSNIFLNQRYLTSLHINDCGLFEVDIDAFRGLVELDLSTRPHASTLLLASH